jgi:hypothetical protein
MANGLSVVKGRGGFIGGRLTRRLLEQGASRVGAIAGIVCLCGLSKGVQ